MVASLKAVDGAGAAASYFTQIDDYYRGQNQAPTAWLGSGAAALGLSGPVDAQAFTQLLEGKLPDGQILGRIGQDGEIEHKPGWDLTFSAPKSVSVMALVEGDERLVAAHEQAVKDTLAWLEKEAAVTRVKEQGGEAKIVQTGNLVAATFRHATSREQQPQLHNHCIILNMTQREDGKWRSLESRAFYRLQMEAGERYRAALAAKCAQLGYQVERTKVAGQVGFELAGVPKYLMDYFSKRSGQIEAELAARGKTLETATPEEKEVAKLATRKAKEAADHADLRAGWQAEARQLGADLANLKNAAQAQTLGPQHARQIEAKALESARAAVKEAAEHLTSREARFSASELATEARRLAMGSAGEGEIQKAIKEAEQSGDLIARQARSFDFRTGQIVEGAGYTTRVAAETERQMLESAKTAQGTAQPLSVDTAAVLARRRVETGFSFNEGQAKAVEGILTSTDRINLVQGYAGTAKTNSVLAAVAAEARARGENVVAIAPTASAAETLGKAIDAQGATVAKHINSRERAAGIWIVDEASMIAAKDMARLLKQAEQAGARVVLVGDVKQLGSVEAGAAFRQLQADSGLKTFVLDEVVRQDNKAARDAVYAAIHGNASAALEKLQNGGGSVRELQTREERVAAIADDYCRQDAKGRAESIVIVPGKDDRQELNDAIRERLKASGDLHGTTARSQTLVTKDLTEVEAKRAENYQVGDVLKAGRNYSRWDIKRGDYLDVKRVDAMSNRLIVEHNGKEIEINPRTATRFQAFESEWREIQAGDRIVFKANNFNFDRRNGQTAEVVKIDAASGKAQIRLDDGKIQTVDLHDRKHQHWSHGYAQTAHESQGRTCQRVFIHAESGRLNLTNQQSFYVAISRAKGEAHVYTNSSKDLGLAVEQRTGQKAQALETGLERLDKLDQGMSL
jgi:conjugative relaxase-like TrwC/TraI family protein